MKKLSKLSINPEKVIKNEELINLRGGEYEDTSCTCDAHLADGDTIDHWYIGYCGVGDCFECGQALAAQYSWLVSADCHPY